MTALNVILSIRSRLRDEDRSNLRFSDEELRRYLEVAQNALILEFDNHLVEFSFKAERPIRFNQRVLGIFKVALNGRDIPNKPRVQALKSRQQCFSLINDREGKLNAEASGTLEVVANCAVEVENLEDEMYLDGMFFNALVLGVLKNMSFVETTEQNLAKIAPYENFYRQEVARLYTLTNKTQTSKIHYTSNTW